jgi:hypothetical protein
MDTWELRVSGLWGCGEGKRGFKGRLIEVYGYAHPARMGRKQAAHAPHAATLVSQAQKVLVRG